MKYRNTMCSGPDRDLHVPALDDYKGDRIVTYMAQMLN